MKKKIKEEAEKKANELHIISVNAYIAQAKKEADEEAKQQKIENDLAIEEAAKEKAATMTAQQVEDYKKQAKIDYDKKIEEHKKDNDAEIERKSQEMLTKKMEEEQAEFYNRDFKYAMMDLGATNRF